MILLTLLTLSQPVDRLSRWKWGENKAGRKRIKEKGRKRERRGSTHQPQSYSLSATSLSASFFLALKAYIHYRIYQSEKLIIRW